MVMCMINRWWARYRGLDNAGKTTCVKYLNHEDVMSISPTLGFSIQTIEHKGFVHRNE